MVLLVFSGGRPIPARSGKYLILDRFSPKPALAVALTAPKADSRNVRYGGKADVGAGPEIGRYMDKPLVVDPTSMEGGPLTGSHPLRHKRGDGV
jgi:hypothetical protein